VLSLSSQPVRADKITPATPPGIETTRKSAFHIESKFIQRVSATLTTSVVSPQTQDGELRVYAPIPPELPSQKIQQYSLRCLQYPALLSEQVTDLKNPYQQYLRLTIPIDGQTLSQKCTVEVNYIVDLYQVQLVRGAGKQESNGTQASLDLTPFTEDSLLANFKDAHFQAWIHEKGLWKTTNESNWNLGIERFAIFTRMDVRLHGFHTIR
jgi:hypothetical protein